LAKPSPVGDFHLLFFASFLAHSELGQKRKCPGSRGTSVLPRTTDIIRPARLVRFVPIGDLTDNFTALFNVLT
jgi:hypothetical protein